MVNQFQGWTQDQLVEEAQTGMRGQGALTEVMCRLKDTLVEQQQVTNRLTKWLIVLTVVILLLTVLLVAVEVFPLIRQIFLQ